MIAVTVFFCSFFFFFEQLGTGNRGYVIHQCFRPTTRRIIQRFSREVGGHSRGRYRIMPCKTRRGTQRPDNGGARFRGAFVLRGRRWVKN